MGVTLRVAGCVLVVGVGVGVRGSGAGNGGVETGGEELVLGFL